jgi:DNA-binding MarR family transcriptional regulator
MEFIKFPILIRSCWFGLNYLFREKISSCPITTVQYTVLRTLFEAHNKKLNQKELASLIATNKNNSSSIVKRLEVLKYIVHIPNPEDKRENIIKITAQGEKVFLLVNQKALELQDVLTNKFSKQELIELSGYMTRINGKLPTKI